MKQLQKTLTLNKPVGKTPLEVVQQYKAEHMEYANAKMAYAGRLDPMAEGQLLVLVGEECKNRDQYLRLDKEYEFEVLLGVETDTYDILGLVNKHAVSSLDYYGLAKIQKIVKKVSQISSLPYPAYSSKTVEGKPLFLWALEKRLGEVTIPHKDITVYSLNIIDHYELSPSRVVAYVEERIGQVTPVKEQSKELGRDFRRVEVLESWGVIEEEYPDHLDRFLVIKLRCVCSSGTYMRTLAHMIGQELGTSGVAWSIKRTKIGTYKKLLGTRGWWTKTY